MEEELEKMEEEQEHAFAVYIASLIHRLREKETLTDAEWSSLSAWRASDPRTEKLFHELNDRQELLSRIRQIDSASFEQPISRLLDKLAGMPRGRVRRMAPRRAWLSAAAIFLLLAGAWLLFKPSKKLPPLTPAIANLPADIAPGTNAAVLTLANGARIILDTARNGQLAQQGQSKVMKTKDGQLVYTAPGTASGTASGIASDMASGAAPGEISYNILTTPRGGQHRLELPDGTMVWLDAASSIRYPVAFKGRERNVAITGQVYFEVAPNTAMPFIVHKDDLSVEVLGTHFNMETYEDEGAARITLLEGAVRVRRDHAAVVLKPGQQAAGLPQQLQVVNDPDLESVMAWKNGLFRFDNTDLMTIMRQAARWYDIEVVYAGSPPDERFKGKVSRNSKLSAFLKILELNNIHFSVEGKRVTVLQKSS